MHKRRRVRAGMQKRIEERETFRLEFGEVIAGSVRDEVVCLTGDLAVQAGVVKISSAKGDFWMREWMRTENQCWVGSAERGGGLRYDFYEKRHTHGMDTEDKWRS